MPWRRGEEEGKIHSRKLKPQEIDNRHHAQVARRYAQQRLMDINHAVEKRHPINVGPFEIPQKVAEHAFTIIHNQKHEIAEITLRRHLEHGGIEESTYVFMHGHATQKKGSLKHLPSKPAKK